MLIHVVVGASHPIESETYSESSGVQMWVRNEHYSIGNLKRRKTTRSYDFLANDSYPCDGELAMGFKTPMAAQNWLAMELNTLGGINLYAIYHAEQVFKAAEAEWERVRALSPYNPKLAGDAFAAQLESRIAYHVLVSNMTASAAETDCTLTRAELIDALDAVIGSTLSFGDAVVMSLESAQLMGEELRRNDCFAYARNESKRVMSDAQFDRAMSVLEAECPRRPDTHTLCPPYALEVNAAGQLRPVA